MGNQDIHRLHPIYRAATDFCRLAELPFSFKVDSGNYETGIVFNIETKSYRKPEPHETWDNVKYPETMVCGDVTSYDHKIIIEIEEETGPRRTGAKLALKGHGHEGDPDTKKDSRRNEYYKMAGFRVLRIWESHCKHAVTWKLNLFEFLINCSRESPILTK